MKKLLLSLLATLFSPMGVTWPARRLWFLPLLPALATWLIRGAIVGQLDQAVTWISAAPLLLQHLAMQQRLSMWGSVRRTVLIS